jgi:diguanylate cyclase (GGDEF)-like protein/PAS domain S-box-containing protein
MKTMSNSTFRASFDNFTVDWNLGLRHSKRGYIKLQPKELSVLIELVSNSGRLITKDHLIMKIWNDQSISDSSIARCISSIKSKLNIASPGSESLIRSVYGEGYIFSGDVKSNVDFLTEESFCCLINQSPDLIACKNGDGHLIALNDQAIRTFGLEGKDWLGKRGTELTELVRQCNRDVFYTYFASDDDAWNNTSPSKYLAGISLEDGNSGTLEITKTPAFHADGSRKLLVIGGRDVTDLLVSTKKQILAEKVLDYSNDAVLITDIQNNIVQINRAFTRMTGYSEDDVIGKNPRHFSSGKHEKSFYQAMWREIKIDGRWHGEIWDRRKNGELYPKWLNISTVHDSSGNIINYIGIFSDLTERKATEKKIELLAYHDQVTRLPNNLLLNDRFDKAAATASRENTLLAVLLLDLDNFVQVSDSLGHEAGNQLLQKAGRRFNQSIREKDTVSRIGAGKFAILLTDLTSTDKISLIVRKLLKSSSKPFAIENIEIISSISIGISIYPNDSENYDKLFMMADASMHHAKNLGRNTFSFFSTNLNADSADILQNRNRVMVATKNSEFTLHYQPRFELKSRRLTGMEALIRWNTAEHGYVPPDKFIPILEETGAIIQVGEWVINEACRQCRVWQLAGVSPLRISVNLSAEQFKKGNIVETVRAALKSTKLPARFLELELAKSILIQDHDEISEILTGLKKIGVILSIGEFGTSYASMSILKEFPIDILQIDKSFVHNMADDESDAAIVHSITQLAHSINRTVIAEGVETQEQIDLLLKEGCDEVQGYFCGSPMPPSEFDVLLKNADSRISSE